MARKKAKALPPKMITVYAEILKETEDGILVRCDEDADGVWLPKSQLKYDGERGDTGVEIEIPDWLANEKGFTDGMGKAKEAAVVPPQAPEPPQDVTLYGILKSHDESSYTFAVYNHDDADTSAEFEIPKEEVVLFRTDANEKGHDAITISRAYALEAGIIAAPEEPSCSGNADDEDDSTPGASTVPNDRHWLAQETITAVKHLTQAEKAGFADDMSKLDAEIDDLEEERDSTNKRLKKLIDAKEEERKALSKIVREGQQQREVFCDRLADYNTCEIVWTDAQPPHEEISRRKMTAEELQLPLEKKPKPKDVAPEEQEGQAEGAEAASPESSIDEPVTLRGIVNAITEEDLTMLFIDYKGEEALCDLSKDEVSFESSLQPGDEAAITMSMSLAIELDIVPPKAPVADPEQGQGTAEVVQ